MTKGNAVCVNKIMITTTRNNKREERKKFT